jgi:hypothetical protein
MKVMTDGLWTVWTTRKRPRLDHTAHSPGDEEVGHFSIVKRVPFQLSRFRRNCSSGSFFDCQMGTFSLDKNTFLDSLYINYRTCPVFGGHYRSR